MCVVCQAGKLGRSDPKLRSLKLGSEQLGDQVHARVNWGELSNELENEANGYYYYMGQLGY